MVKGKLIVFEGIYGAGRLIVDLVSQVRHALVQDGSDVYEIDSPDSGRARLMGAAELDGTWRYGRFEPDFFFELAGRARVAAVTQDKLAEGKVVLCKSFTLSSMVYASLQGHDWFREDLNVLEARARGLAAGRELTPDLTVFVDVAPDTAASELGGKLAPLFKPADLVRQRELYLAELPKLPAGKVKVIGGSRSAEAIFPDVIAAVRSLA
jgi:thymidylate kinase